MSHMVRALQTLALLAAGIVVLGLVVGCVPTVEDLAADCRAYGFSPATVEMAQCVQASQQAWQADYTNSLAAMNATWQAQQQNNLYEQQLRQQRFDSMRNALRATEVQRVRVIP